MSNLKQYKTNIGFHTYTTTAGSRLDAAWKLCAMIPGKPWTPDRLDPFIDESPVPTPLQGYGAFGNYAH